VPKKEAANSTCANTIAVTSTKHKLSLKTQGLLPTRELVFGLTRLDDTEILTMVPSHNRNLTVTVIMMSAAWVQKKSALSTSENELEILVRLLASGGKENTRCLTYKYRQGGLLYFVEHVSPRPNPVVFGFVSIG